MEDIMKKGFCAGTVIVLFFMVVMGAEAVVAKSLYDDFSGAYIDAGKWEYRELVREVDPVAGKLVSKIGNPSVSGSFWNGTDFQNPESVSAIECEITVVATKLDTGNGAFSTARIEGDFYNTEFFGGATGEIRAVVGIGDQGNGLEAYWQVLEYLNDNLTDWDIIGSGTLIPAGRLTHGMPYTVKIKYDGTNRFQFTVDGETQSVVGPSRTRAAVKPLKGLLTGTGTSSGSASGTGYVSALFDDVYINNGAIPYDTFDSASLDQTKWQGLEVVRELSGGKLRMNVLAKDSDYTIGNSLKDNPAYLEAKVTVKSGSWVSAGTHGIAGIVGGYYNDTRGPDSGDEYYGYEGNVAAQNWIEFDHNNNLKAGSAVIRCDDANRSTWTRLFSQEFSTPISFDTPYTLSIEFTGSEFIFKCNDETTSYQVTTATYEPYDKDRSLESKVDADPGESGYMKADFDDVYTNGSGDASGGGGDGGGGGGCFISTAANGFPVAPLALPGLIFLGIIMAISSGKRVSTKL
jgi:hypothetical protein